MMKKLKKLSKACFLILVIVSCLSSVKVTRAEESKTFSKSDIEKIVRDYIMENPEDILTSLAEFQQQTMKNRQVDALEQYKSAVFNDSMSPEAGNLKGDVTVVEFIDYNCHYCKVASSTVRDILNTDKNVRFIFKELPILRDSSATAAKWALAADKQGKYLAFHNAMMDNKQPIDDALLEKVAGKVGLDLAKVKKDINDKSIEKQIKDVRDLATKLGLTGTPAFVIGEEIKFGAISEDEFKKKIADLRAAKKESEK